MVVSFQGALAASAATPVKFSKRIALHTASFRSFNRSFVRSFVRSSCFVRFCGVIAIDIHCVVTISCVIALVTVELNGRIFFSQTVTQSFNKITSNSVVFDNIQCVKFDYCLYKIHYQ